MAYGAALERRFGSNPIEGSNPSLSARKIMPPLGCYYYFSDRSLFEPEWVRNVGDISQGNLPDYKLVCSM